MAKEIRPDQYSHDVEWGLITRLRKMGVRLLKDNSLERGPLKAIKLSRRILDRYKFWQTTALHWRMQNDLLKNKTLPCTIQNFPSDVIQHWNRHLDHPIGRQNLIKNNWLINGERVEIDYHINKQGFRHDGTCPDYHSEKGGIIYIGDSHTMGVGLPIEQSWTYIAHHTCEETMNKRYINMGCPGYGIDSFYRLLKYHLDQIKPEMVVMSYPWQSTRTEVYDHTRDMWESVTINKESRSKLAGKNNSIRWFHTATSYARWYKALDAIKWLCYNNDCKLFAIEEDKPYDKSLMNITDKFCHQIDDEDWARDLVHSGRKTHLHNGDVLAEALTYILKED